MDTKLLQSWLSLPPGNWPPEPHALLGMTAGSLEGLHDRALAQMERLRPHQLRHPELVTEGMNRLAQALIALETASIAPMVAIDFKPETAAATQLAPPVVLVAEVIQQDFPIVQATIADIPKRKRKKRRKTGAPLAPSTPAVAEAAALEADRRKNYRQLAVFRKAHRAWERLGPFFGVPSQELLTSGDVYRYLIAIAENREAYRNFKSWPIRNGILSSSVINGSATLALYRQLQKQQRETLAADWAHALGDWRSRILSLSSALKTTRPQPSWRRRLRSIRRGFATRPEWIFPGVFLGLAAGVTILRMLR